LGFGVLLAGLVIFGGKLVSAHPRLFAGALIGSVAAYVAAGVRMGIWANRMFRELGEARDAQGEIRPTQPAWEYRSRLEWLGLPLVHVRFSRSSVQRRPVKAW